MDPQDRHPNFIGTTIIDLDIDSNNIPGNNDLPGWLREVLDRALTASGFKTKKKSASDEAMESLKELDLSTLEESDCPICFDPYEPSMTKDSQKESNQKNGTDSNRFKEVSKSYEKLLSVIRAKYGEEQMFSLEEAARFNDPSLFLPVDEGALHYSRFPIRNLSTLEEVSIENQIPGYVDEEKAKKEKNDKLKNEGHFPVKMPNCDHIFGKSCIVEWLKSNVSCPLCRKEVEASKDDPKALRLSRIQDNTFSNFNEREASIDHLVNNSTDVFNPFRRPYARNITPLTDSFMHQDWATSSGTDDRVGFREPNLVLPRRFPFPESSAHYITLPMRNNTRTARRDTDRTDTATDNRAPEGEVSNRPASVSSTIDSNARSVSPQNDTPISSQRISSPSYSSTSSINGGGGPERRRNNPNSGRLHPYSRPPPED